MSPVFFFSPALLHTAICCEYAGPIVRLQKKWSDATVREFLLEKNNVNIPVQYMRFVRHTALPIHGSVIIHYNSPIRHYGSVIYYTILVQNTHVEMNLRCRNAVMSLCRNDAVMT